ncbi:hypothetical protein M8997_001720 [Phyllobacterium sp. 21LDTY02-6]|uniref:hypothetical protein n=1 Tax=Phyllobacterium sp. 21LDTY02-6 TaxID=2944903 RepID=UPI0020220B1B|nr:hypothetical protein [Phyllobacterium sp. 21LDTY02-6]MCO4315888.1 hypothetical protein [Phyllobacterium sp. 21LDTY02-6]
MLRDIPGDVVVGLKDRLRDMRHIIRASRKEEANSVGELPEMVVGTVARIMDKAFTAAESVSISLVSRDPSAHAGTVSPASIQDYFPPFAAAGRARFQRDMYYLTKTTMRALGVPNALVHEQHFGDIHSNMVRRHAALTQRAVGGDAAAIGRACGHLAMQLQEDSGVTALGRQQADLRLLCNASIALGVGIATFAGRQSAVEMPVESALLALRARPERLSEAYRAKDPALALGTLFASLIPHLP